uniref:Putative secreted protein n=1 Tax=Anopheles darlingi TaxID=43151 RepID=A0A2M4DJV3_ANODA
MFMTPGNSGAILRTLLLGTWGSFSQHMGKKFASILAFGVVAEVDPSGGFVQFVASRGVLKWNRPTASMAPGPSTIDRNFQESVSFIHHHFFPFSFALARAWFCKFHL